MMNNDDIRELFDSIYTIKRGETDNKPTMLCKEDIDYVVNSIMKFDGWLCNGCGEKCNPSYEPLIGSGPLCHTCNFKVKK